MPRASAVALIASASAGCAAWVSLGWLAVTGDGGAARVAFLPPLWLLPLLVLGAVLVAWTSRLSASTSLPLFFSLILLLPWLPSPTPAAFLIWSGPMEFLVWTAIAAAVLLVRTGATSPPLPPRPFLAGAIALAAYLS